MKDTLKKFTFWFVFILMHFIIYKDMLKEVKARNKSHKEISYSRFIKEVQAGNIEEVTLLGKETIKGSFKKLDSDESKTLFKTIGNIGHITQRVLIKHGIVLNYIEEKRPLFFPFLIKWLPFFILMICFQYFFLKEKKHAVNTTNGPDNNNLLKASDHKFNSYRIYKISLTSFEVHIVKEAILQIKKKYNNQIETKRSGEHISLICSKFIESKTTT